MARVLAKDKNPTKPPTFEPKQSKQFKQFKQFKPIITTSNTLLQLQAMASRLAISNLLNPTEPAGQPTAPTASQAITPTASHPTVGFEIQPPTTPQRSKRSHETGRTDRIRIRTLHQYGGFHYEDIFRTFQGRFTLRQIQWACTGPTTPQKAKKKSGK